MATYNPFAPYLDPTSIIDRVDNGFLARLARREDDFSFGERVRLEKGRTGFAYADMHAFLTGRGLCSTGLKLFLEFAAKNGSAPDSIKEIVLRTYAELPDKDSPIDISRPWTEFDDIAMISYPVVKKQIFARLPGEDGTLRVAWTRLAPKMDKKSLDYVRTAIRNGTREGKEEAVCRRKPFRDVLEACAEGP